MGAGARRGMTETGKPKKTPTGRTANLGRTDLPLRHGAASPSAPYLRAEPRKPALGGHHSSLPTHGARTSHPALAVRGFTDQHPRPQRPEKKKPLQPALGPIAGATVPDGRPSAASQVRLSIVPGPGLCAARRRRTLTASSHCGPRAATGSLRASPVQVETRGSGVPTASPAGSQGRGCATRQQTRPGAGTACALPALVGCAIESETV